VLIAKIKCLSPEIFKLLVGLTPTHFKNVLDRIKEPLSMMVLNKWDKVKLKSGRPRKITEEVLLIITLIYMKHYPVYSLLCLLFELDSSNLSIYINAVIKQLYLTFKGSVRIPPRQERLKHIKFFLR